MCHCMIAKLVVSRFPKDRDIRKQWVFDVKRVTTENKAWIPGANDYDVVCHSVTSSILITDRLNHSEINIDLHPLRS